MNEFLPHITSSINDTLRSLSAFTPEIILVAGFLLIILTDLFLSRKLPQLTFILALLTIIISGLSVAINFTPKEVFVFGEMLILNKMANVFKLIFCFATTLFILFIRSNKRLQSHSKGIGDLFTILMAVQLGLYLMAMSNNLLMVYLSLEMVSVGSYLMVGYLSDDSRQTEAAMKYALFGAVCSAIMLYGISLLYGFTGTLSLTDPAFLAGLAVLPQLSAALAIGMFMAGVWFKLSLVPFHFWAPDVYQGAATPVTAFLSTAPKIAGIAILINFMNVFYGPGKDSIEFPFKEILMVLATASMVIGNFGAIWQDNVKRMLAYSSIGHTGFMLMAILVFSDNGFNALFFYIVIYVIMNMAAFMIADEIEEQTGIVEISNYKGLGKTFPLLMILMVVVLVSLTGIPPTAGFTAKFLVFSAALEYYGSGGSNLALVMILTGAVSTVVSLFYYFRIPRNAFLKNADKPITLNTYSMRIVMAAFLVLLLFVFIIFPGLIMNLI